LQALSDFDLVRRTNSGSTEAFAVLVERYHKPLQRLSMRYVRDAQLAEDIVQESFLKAFEKLTSFQFRSAFKSWLYRIVINTAKNSLRGSRTTVDLEKVSLKVENQCEDTLIEKQLFEESCKIIEDLPEKQRQAVSLRVFSDLSFKEVASKMDCPYDTAKANYRHGLLKIKEKMVIAW
jgi:RNA polymerase sigma-70 factor (ECF subfamily)